MHNAVALCRSLVRRWAFCHSPSLATEFTASTISDAEPASRHPVGLELLIR